LQKKIRIERELKERQKRNPLNYYWPHAPGCDGKSCNEVKFTYKDYYGTEYEVEGCPQYQFHTSKATTRGLFGSNRSGKTVAGVVEMAIHLTGHYPEWWIDEKKWNKAIKARFFTTDFKKGVGEVLQDKIAEWFPEGAIKDREKNNAGIYDKYWIKHESGKISSFDIMTYEQQARMGEGWSGHMAWYDECIEGSQKVLMSNGVWRAIKDIKVGDKLWVTHDNYLRVKARVKAKFNKGKQFLVKVTTRAGYEILCTPDHHIWTTNRGYVEAQYLTTDDILYSPTFNIKGKDTIERRLAFMLGAWIGDGYFDKSIFMACGNSVFLQELQDSVKQIKHKVGYAYRIVDNDLKTLLIKTELKGRKSYNKFIPELIYKQGLKNIIAFLEGLYATDGWFCGHVIGYGTTSKELAEGLRLLLGNIGIRACINFKRKQDEKWNDQYFVMITQKHNVLRFCELVDVKSKQFSEEKVRVEATRRIGDSNVPAPIRRQKDSRRRVKAVIPYGEGIVYDITVSPTHSIICNGLRVSNCPPESHRIATLRGLTDFFGWEVFTATPVSEPYLYDEIYASKDPDVECFTMDIRHNLVRPNPLTKDSIGLTEEAIQRYERSIKDPGEFDARIHGKFKYLTGRIWKIWDRPIHTFNRNIWKKGEKNCLFTGQPPRHWPRIFLIDPHDEKPHALLWVALEPEYNRYFVYREALLKNCSFTEVVRHIRDVEVENREKIAVRIMDPNFGPKTQGYNRRTVRDDFEEASMNIGYAMSFDFGNDNKARGRKAVEELMWYDTTQPISIINRPKIQVAGDLHECIYHIEHYVWDENKHGTERDPREKPKDIATDFNDLLHYLSLSEFNGEPAEVVHGPGKFYA